MPDGGGAHPGLGGPGTGGATYGRWGEETLRLVPGRVEISSDNRSFHTAFDQGPNCSIPNG